MQTATEMVLIMVKKLTLMETVLLVRMVPIRTIRAIILPWLTLDCDGDGVPNGEEVDPDNDGTPGPNGTDPSDPCDYDVAIQSPGTVTPTWNALDCDDDGIINGEEILNGSDPL